LSDSYSIEFKNYACFLNDRNLPRIGGSTLIVCKNYLDPICYPNHSSNFRGCEFSMISVKLPNINTDKILIISAYKPPDIKFTQED